VDHSILKVGDIVQQVQDAMWQPEYRRIEAVVRRSRNLL
jgi:hypothetical protein